VAGEGENQTLACLGGVNFKFQAIALLPNSSLLTTVGAIGMQEEE